MIKYRKQIIPVLVLIAILLIPTPAKITPQAWKIFAVFTSTIVALVLKVSNMGTIGIFGLTIGACLGAFSMKEALTAFGSPISWQIVSVFFIARGFVKTGLSKRISFHIMKFFGKSTLGLGYGFVFSNVILGPLIPSSAARIGGILYPIIKSVSEILGSRPEDGTQKKVGAFFILLCLYSNAIVSAMFLTAAAGNLIIEAIVTANGIHISWLTWFYYALIPSLACLLLMPLFLYFIYPPELEDISKTRKLIDNELNSLGKFSQKEKKMSMVLITVLLSWIFGDYIKIDAILTSFIGLCILIVTQIIDFENDVLTEKEAWHTLIWLSSLILVAQKLEQSGFLNVIIDSLEIFVRAYSWPIALAILICTYGYSHYLFASNVSHISAMYAVFLGVAIKSGAPALLSALVLAFTSSLFAGLHYYSSTEAVVLYNSNYVSMRDFFIQGITVTSFIFFLWMLSGIVWWKVTGLF